MKFSINWAINSLYDCLGCFLILFKDSTIDLSNWVIDNLVSGVNNNIVIPAGKSITPNGFFLISNDTEADSVISITPDHQTSSISLQNNGEQLILRTSAGGTILDIANGTGAWLAGDDNPEKSMERNSTPGDGAVGVSWHTATSATNIDTDTDELATPRAANSTP